MGRDVYKRQHDAIRLELPLLIIRASAQEQAAHAQLRALLAQSSGGRCLWDVLEPMTEHS